MAECNSGITEGRAVISFNQPEYTFCNEPKRDKTCRSKKVIQNVEMEVCDDAYVAESKYFVTKPTIMTAKDDFDLELLQGYGKPVKNVSVKKGTRIKNFGDVSEASTRIQIGNQEGVVELYLYSPHLENWKQEPNSEWWIKIVGKGWMQIKEHNVRFHDSRF